jgi:hypothetical protein
MEAWLAESPYRWVGYYLGDAPCYTGTSWNGRRTELERMGWGIALVFVGEQDWPGVMGEPEPADAGETLRCTRANLTPERAASDAAAAHRTAEADGFPDGTVVYLDVERVDSPSRELLRYVEGWASGLLSGGRYLPGLYAHAGNAAALHDAMTGAFRSGGHTDLPRLWIAGGEGFHTGSSPAESPFPFAEIWQGAFDARETWGGVTLRIDVNVARRRSPS